VLRFRLSEPGGYSWQLNCDYQQRAPRLTTPQSVFAWPDDLAFVLNEVALVYAYRFAKGISSAEAKGQLGIAQQSVMSAMAGEERESISQGYVPEFGLLR
jgi:hypothetical protein